MISRHYLHWIRSKKSWEEGRLQCHGRPYATSDSDFEYPRPYLPGFRLRINSLSIRSRALKPFFSNAVQLKSNRGRQRGREQGMKLHHSREPRLPREVHSEAQVKVAEIGVKLNQILRQWQKGGGHERTSFTGPKITTFWSTEWTLE